jgi:hypothetical protein
MNDLFIMAIIIANVWSPKSKNYKTNLMISISWLAIAFLSLIWGK